MKEVTIHILRCGGIELTREAVFGGSQSSAALLRLIAAPVGRRLTLPCFCYLIEHPKGLVLFDTGIGRAFSPDGVFDGEAVRALIGRTLCSFMRPRVAPGMSIGEQLSSRGLRPSDLDCVILSHLDSDHTGGLHELRGAKRILLPEDEYFWTCRTVYKLRQPSSLWMDMGVERFWYRGSPLGSNRWAYDLFGDESFMLVNLPGHTDGMCAALIRNGGRFAVLGSDAAICRENLDSLSAPGYCFDKVFCRRSLEWLREMRGMSGCEAVLLSHDAEEERGIVRL